MRQPETPERACGRLACVLRPSPKKLSFRPDHLASPSTRTDGGAPNSEQRIGGTVNYRDHCDVFSAQATAHKSAAHGVGAQCASSLRITS